MNDFIDVNNSVRCDTYLFGISDSNENFSDNTWIPVYKIFSVENTQIMFKSQDNERDVEIKVLTHFIYFYLFILWIEIK